eukprot:100800_1
MGLIAYFLVQYSQYSYLFEYDTIGDIMYYSENYVILWNGINSCFAAESTKVLNITCVESDLCAEINAINTYEINMQCIVSDSCEFPCFLKLFFFFEMLFFPSESVFVVCGLHLF